MVASDLLEGLFERGISKSNSVFTLFQLIFERAQAVDVTVLIGGKTFAARHEATSLSRACTFKGLLSSFDIFMHLLTDLICNVIPIF